MSCITACLPERIDRNPASRSRLRAAVRSVAIAPAAMGILVELGVTDPVPAFNAPAIANQLQQRLWCGAQAGEEEVGGLKELAPSRRPVAVTSTIQLVPAQASRMCSGACLARRLQVMLRRWLIS
jgi:hypothetical protein